MTNRLVFLLDTIIVGFAVVSRPCRITWFSYAMSKSFSLPVFHSSVRSPGSSTGPQRSRSGACVSEPRQITWFFYREDGHVGPDVVSESCQIAWFSYQPMSNRLAIEFQSHVRSPGSLTVEVIAAPEPLFQSRARSPGSITNLA